jgi:hypothetical protein
MTSDENTMEQSASTEPAGGADRRSFLRGSVTAAAAVAGAGMGGLAAASEAGNIDQEEAVKTRKPLAAYQLQFSTSRPPSVEDVHAALARILGHAGCTTCGLLGVDVRLLAVDPIPVETRVPVQGSLHRF